MEELNTIFTSFIDFIKGIIKFILDTFVTFIIITLIISVFILFFGSPAEYS